MAREQPDAHQHAEPLHEVFTIVRREHHAQDESEGRERTQQAGLPDAGQVYERTDRGRAAGGGQTAVHFGQMLAQPRIPEGGERE